VKMGAFLLLQTWSSAESLPPLELEDR
jgi:hypothetical protein